MNDKDLIKELCKALAFHAHETEITATMSDPSGRLALMKEVQSAKKLIKKAGHNIDKLYPEEGRTVVSNIDAANTEISLI